MTGNVYVHHQTGRADYHVTRALYGFINDDLYIEIDAEPSSEHGLAFLGSLALELNGLPVGTSEITDCVGREFHLPTSQNDDPTINTDRFTNLYLGEHYDVDENVITISNDDGIILEWIGVAPDLRFYDERAKDNRIELKCTLESGLFQRTEKKGIFSLSRCVWETERSTVKRFLRIVIIVFVFVVLACLPVVPISIAPVVPNPTYSFRMVTFLEILWFLLARPVGVSYQWYWYTFAVILVLLAVGYLVSVLVLRKTGASSNN